MFKDLLSSQSKDSSSLLFYANRLQKESSVRLMGFGFLLLAALIQLSAGGYHPHQTLAGAPSLDGLTPADNARCSVTATALSSTSINVITSVYNNGIPVAAYQGAVDGAQKFYVATSAQSLTRTVSGLSAGNHSVFMTVFLLTPNDNKIHHYTTCSTQITPAPSPPPPSPTPPPPPAKIVTSKTVSDTTHPFTTTSSTAKAGDELIFKLNTQNSGGTDYHNYTGRDNFGSVLQFASIESQSQLSQQGIVLDHNNYLNWTTLDLKAHTTDVKSINVKVKSPLPAAGTSACKITNTYGNTVTVNLTCPPPPTTPPPASPPPASPPPPASTLPNTGPGTSVAIAFIVAVAAGYFWSRSRLMAHELEIAAEGDI